MWWLFRHLLNWMQQQCISAVRFLFAIVSISIGTPPFRESPPDAPPNVVMRIYKMIKAGAPINKKILVLDLDETLVHASTTPQDPTHFDVLVPTGRGQFTVMYVCERPYLQYFLAHVSHWFTVTIFTAATKEYALPIIRELDREKIIKKRYYRTDCSYSSGQYVKDLSRLSGCREDLFSNYIIIDNLPASYKHNPHNAVPISDFRAANHSSDKELLKLLPLLEALQAVKDVRPILELRSNPTKSFVNRITR
eukprot:TRINITY_DN27093_c0_g1_i1.p1 TRINITY_DN27093_c0_g1~~TRINITY_DN27093_c0_g1_i1.p1  ORF type:complete len:266 (+),score=14.42 TRINITY_DN27093_c0_g1_i1:46-798(+)